MTEKRTSIQKVILVTLLITTIFSFSNCKKNGTELATPVSSEAIAANTLAAVSTGTGTALTLNAKLFISDGGFAYQISNVGTGGDSNASPSVSKLRLFENGVELNPAHSVHQDIRTLGKGRFSHWGTNLVISASDNTDPRVNGKSYVYTLDGSTPSGTTAAAQPSTSTTVNTTGGPIGYANVNGLTTGGQGGKTVTVTTLADFKNAIQSSETMIVQVSGSIKSSGATLLYVQSNKSVIGLKGSSLEGISLSVYGQHNVIIRNITSKNSLTYSNIIIKEGSHHVWVDHCDLSSTLLANDWTTYDGLLDVGDGSDFVTISWNKIHDSHIPVLIGFADTDTGDAGKLNVTIYNNYFYNTNERQPSVRFGKVHVFNNYINNNQGGYAMGARCGAIIRTDNNVVENSNAPLRTEISASAGYFSGISTNIFKNCGANKITTTESAWIPGYEYKTALIPAAQVQAAVTASAGATL